MPKRTFLGWTKLASTAATLLTLLIVMGFLFRPQAKSVIAPGPLSSAHAQLLTSGHFLEKGLIASNNRCAACHPNGSASNHSTIVADANPLAVLISTQTKNKTQSQLCMDCHIETMPNGLLGNPHDLSGDDLKALLNSVKNSSPKQITQSPTECSQCHREHQGPDGQLQSIASAQCQACHRKQFESFAKGHPEFVQYPSESPRSIAFDHARHAELHFSKKGKSFDCRTCHLSSNDRSAVGNIFRSVSFERACADCHAESIKTAASEGIVVLQVPSLDRKRLSDAGYELGAWPESASLFMDGTLSPLLIAFLSSNEEGRAILAQLPQSGRLNEVDLKSPEQCGNLIAMAAQVRLIWSALASQGQPMFRTTMKTALESQLEHRSFSNPSYYVSTSPSIQTPPTSISPSPLRFEQLRESVTTQWLDQVASGLPPDLMRTSHDKWFQQSPRNTSLGTIRHPLHREILTAGAKLGLPQRTDNDSDLLSSDPDLLTSPATLSLEPPLEDSNSPVSTIAEKKPLKAWEHVAYGGWMIDESRVALVYIPRGHADPWVTRWLEWQKLSASESLDRLDSLSKQCIQCHSFDEQRVRDMLEAKDSDHWFVSQKSRHSGREESLNDSCWKIKQRSIAQRELTRFNHTPHLTVSSLRDCQSCHQLIKLEGAQGSAQNWSESGRGIRHEFEYMKVGQCVSCHTKQSAGDSCTQCHNYHVHGFRSNDKRSLP